VVTEAAPALKSAGFLKMAQTIQNGTVEGLKRELEAARSYQQKYYDIMEKITNESVEAEQKQE